MAKRERGDKERVSERDSAWESTGDRRWAAEERDSRAKRPTRDRKAAQGDDAKDREERRDREKEREKEKEPAWMDTYIPNGPSLGILGGRGADGELDGIQAWKKGMKEKEQREREKEQGPSPTVGQGEVNADNSVDKVDALEKQLDEIQLFKLLMKREEEKKKVDMCSNTAPTDPVPPALSMSNGKPCNLCRTVQLIEPPPQALTRRIPLPRPNQTESPIVRCNHSIVQVIRRPPNLALPSWPAHAQGQALGTWQRLDIPHNPRRLMTKLLLRIIRVQPRGSCLWAVHLYRLLNRL